MGAGVGADIPNFDETAEKCVKWSVLRHKAVDFLPALVDSSPARISPTASGPGFDLISAKASQATRFKRLGFFGAGAFPYCWLMLVITL